MNNFFLIFSNCQLTKGLKRSTITDFQRNKTYIIPNDLYEIIIKAKQIMVSQIYLEYGADNKDTLDNYFNFLTQNELGFYCDDTDRHLFPDLDLTFNNPKNINNCVIEEPRELKSFNKIVSELDSLGCEYVELIFYKEVQNDFLNELLNIFIKKSIKNIGLIFKFDKTKGINYLKELCSKNLRLIKILIHSCEDDRVDITHNLTKIIYINKCIYNSSFCGNINKSFFSSTMEHYTESLVYNTCLNKKIAIDINGEIRNCPSMKESYGNIKSTSLSKVIDNDSYRKYWTINKSQIHSCKSCEFRHICTDCRAYIDIPEDYYSKPLKCGYNPHTNEWQEWSTNPLKQKIIEYYRMQELVKKE